MRHLPRRLPPIALAGLLALGACAAPGPDAGFDDAGVPATGAEARVTTGSQEASPQPRAKDASAYTVRHSDGYKTVITLDRTQVERLTGTDLASGVAATERALAERGTWSGADTKDHAAVVVRAAARESDRIDRVLGAMTDGRDIELRLYVAHHRHAHVAHFGEDDD
ncbi:MULTISPECIES: hypothetical protein [unclassified Isoptericola]|uniref:hypothetical protein n=1 Tax=unclassified Isoptericola TaxID=2623355 RepID=UPI00364808CE